MIKLQEQEIQNIQRAAEEVYPREMAGLIVDGKFVQHDNIHSDPFNGFKISTNEYLKAQETGKLEAVIHSHPYSPKKSFKYDPRWASASDMKTWIALGVPFGIIGANGVSGDNSDILWYDDNEIAPLEGRNFVHGLTDCYSLVRDYFRLEKNITLNNYPRSMEWWFKNEDLYSENFEKEGFVVIPKEQAQVGDCCLFQVASKVINHAAVITGPNQILHHLIHRLSGTDSLSRWDKYITKYVRYEGTQR